MAKKDVLFYTFLGIFIVTAIITFLGLLNLVQIKEGYLDKLLVVVAVECCGAVIGLFKKTDFFEDHKSETTETKHENCKSPVQKKTNSVTPKIGPVSAQEYFDTLDKFSNRFAEQREFIASIHGSVINWRGAVCSVTGYSDGSASICLSPSNLVPCNYFYLKIPSSCSARALALHQGDVISFTTTLDTSIHASPHLQAETFKLEAGTLAV
jgi:hypothetical protein